MKLVRKGTVEELLPAPPEAIWSVLTDPTRIGQWSSECRTGRWLDGANEPVVGARFTGRNRVRWIGWTRACQVLEAASPRRYVFETISPTDCTRWSFHLDRVGTGTRVRQSFEIRRMWKALEALITVLIPEHFDRTDSLRADLVRLGQVAARTTPSRRPIDAG